MKKERLNWILRAYTCVFDVCVCYLGVLLYIVKNVE